ncbi:UNVERIFIED_CONTAM: hypothetical protein GTU68_029917 [Idotea baltica]|nr:hypothetical protein [Idotea baltica]
MHSRGHETHYKIVVVSQDFENLKQVSRHQKIYASLKTLMQDIHALAIHAYTPQEWKTSAIVTASPTCLGGGKL